MNFHTRQLERLFSDNDDQLQFGRCIGVTAELLEVVVPLEGEYLEVYTCRTPHLVGLLHDRRIHLPQRSLLDERTERVSLYEMKNYL